MDAAGQEAILRRSPLSSDLGIQVPSILMPPSSTHGFHGDRRKGKREREESCKDFYGWTWKWCTVLWPTPIDWNPVTQPRKAGKCCPCASEEEMGLAPI